MIRAFHFKNLWSTQYMSEFFFGDLWILILDLREWIIFFWVLSRCFCIRFNHIIPHLFITTLLMTILLFYRSIWYKELLIILYCIYQRLKCAFLFVYYRLYCGFKIFKFVKLVIKVWYAEIIRYDCDAEISFTPISDE